MTDTHDALRAALGSGDPIRSLTEYYDKTYGWSPAHRALAWDTVAAYAIGTEQERERCAEIADDEYGRRYTGEAAIIRNRIRSAPPPASVEGSEI